MLWCRRELKTEVQMGSWTDLRRKTDRVDVLLFPGDNQNLAVNSAAPGSVRALEDHVITPGKKVSCSEPH